MVIDGESLQVALSNHRELLADVSCQSSAVVCCRMSPLQKAEVSINFFGNFSFLFL
jgi:phospholipid-translocating ATPase